MSLVRRIPTFLAATLVVVGVAGVALTTFTARPARADDLDLEDDDGKANKTDKTGKKEPSKDDVLLSPGPIATIRPHAYTLGECLSLSERNHPNLWAARARLAFVHAQLDEARWTPFSYWSASATTGVLPTIGGTPFYNAVPRSALNQGFGQDFQPFLTFGVRGTIPIGNNREPDRSWISAMASL